MEQNQLSTIMSAGEEDQGTQFSPTKIDCTGIIEDVITKTSEHHQKTMSQITTNLEVQRANIDTMVQPINNLAQLMSQSVAYSNLNTQNSVRLSQQQTNFNTNCNFLVPKRTNVEIWTIIAGALRTNDNKLTKIQEKSAASTTQILKAASELTRLYANEQTSEAVKGPLTMLKDGLSLAGKANQDLNQLRRELTEPSLPPKYKKLAKNVDNSASLLFGDSISERLDDLQKENKVKSLLTEKPYLKEGTYTKQPNYTQRKRPHNDAATGASNCKSSSKPQKRTRTQGQNYRKERPQQQHKSNRYQNRYKN